MSNWKRLNPFPLLPTVLSDKTKEQVNPCVFTQIDPERIQATIDLVIQWELGKPKISLLQVLDTINTFGYGSGYPGMEELRDFTNMVREDDACESKYSQDSASEMKLLEMHSKLRIDKLKEQNIKPVIDSDVFNVLIDDLLDNNNLDKIK